MPTSQLLCAVFAVVLSHVAAAQTPQSTAQSQFESLKKLQGTWTGKAHHGEQASDVTVTYKVTANGTAVVETQFAGSPHEMVTMYYLDGKDLKLTHYCAAGNQPQMKAKKPGSKTDTGNVIDFEFAGGTNITKQGMHMHSAHVRLVDTDHVESVWESYSQGRKVSEAKFVLARQSE